MIIGKSLLLIALQANKGTSRKNVIGHILDDAAVRGGIEKNWNFILGDFVLVIVAGRFATLETSTN